MPARKSPVVIPEWTCTHHTSPRLLSNEGIPEDLGQSAHTKRNMLTVPSQWTNTLLEETSFQMFKKWLAFTLRSEREPFQKPDFTLRASRLRLISAVSIKVLRSLLLTSVPRSFPAKSTNENLPCSVEARLLRRKEIWSTAWERDELLFAEVWPDVLRWQWKRKYRRSWHRLTEKKLPKNKSVTATYLYEVPIWIILMTSSAEDTYTSSRPTTWTCCLSSSRTRNLAFLFSRSKT